MKSTMFLDWLSVGSGKLNTSKRISLHVCLSELEPPWLNLPLTKENKGEILSKWKRDLQRKGGLRIRASLKNQASWLPTSKRETQHFTKDAL